jgi:hypothetical protein
VPERKRRNQDVLAAKVEIGAAGGAADGEGVDPGRPFREQIVVAEDSRPM